MRSYKFYFLNKIELKKITNGVLNFFQIVRFCFEESKKEMKADS